MPNLGAKLAENLKIAQAATEDAREKAIAQQNAAEKQLYSDLTTFFEQVKLYWTTSIESGCLAKSLGIQIGTSGPYSTRQRKIDFDPDKFYSGAQLYNQKQTNGVPGYFGTPKWDKPSVSPYYLAWKEFEKWCTENGLTVTWAYCWDGGGMHSWYELQVSPSNL